MQAVETTSEIRPTSQLVVEAISEQAGVDPLELDVPLGEVVDPDALDAMFDPPFVDGRRRGRIEFTYCDYRVTVVSHPDDVSVDVTPTGEVSADTSVDPGTA